MLVTIIPNFALFSYFTTDRFHYQLYGHLAQCLKTDEGIVSSKPACDQELSLGNSSMSHISHAPLEDSDGWMVMSHREPHRSAFLQLFPHKVHNSPNTSKAAALSYIQQKFWTKHHGPATHTHGRSTSATTVPAAATQSLSQFQQHPLSDGDARIASAPPLEPNTRYRGMRINRFGGVEDWLLERSEFREWRGVVGQTGKAVLFFPGIRERARHI